MDKDRVALDDCAGGMEPPVRARDLERLERLARRGQPLPRKREADAQSGALRLSPLAHPPRAGYGNRIHPGLGDERQPAADLLLVPGMDIGGLADVDSDGLPRRGEREGP